MVMSTNTHGEFGCDLTKSEPLDGSAMLRTTRQAVPGEPTGSAPYTASFGSLMCAVALTQPYVGSSQFTPRPGCGTSPV
jgi:hypothetical protein